MEVGIKRVCDFESSLWAGGMTTQLDIYPQGARYGDRDFVWRLSSATVEVEESDFTSLPDYDRVLLVLEGSLRLIHKGIRDVVLSTLEQDFFGGEYETKSYGKVRDFNLMVRKGNEGFVQVVGLEQAATDFEVIKSDKYIYRSEMFYLLDGDCTVRLNGDSFVIKDKELFVASGNADEFGDLSIYGKGKVIRAFVHFA